MKKKIRECLHCINFKTIVVNDENIKQHLGLHCVSVFKRIKKDGQVRVYFCKWGLLHKAAYVHTNMVKRIRRECHMYNKAHKDTKILCIK